MKVSTKPGPAPFFTLTGGTWSGGKYVVDVNDTLTVITSLTYIPVEPLASQPQDGRGHGFSVRD